MDSQADLGFGNDVSCIDEADFKFADEIGFDTHDGCERLVFWQRLFEYIVIDQSQIMRHTISSLLGIVCTGMGYLTVTVIAS